MSLNPKSSAWRKKLKWGLIVSSAATLVGIALYQWAKLALEIPRDQRISINIAAALQTFHDTGETGVLLDAENCYRKIQAHSSMDDIKRCLTIDLTGYYLDREFRLAMNGPISPNFSDSSTFGRLSAAFNTIHLNRRCWDGIVYTKWVPDIRRQFYEVQERDLKILHR